MDLTIRIQSANIFSQIPDEIRNECFQTILKKDGIRIERIISKGHVTPVGEWYDQDWDEWILLLQGGAKLNFEGNGIITLSRGDYCLIPAHSRHRVEWTDSEIETLWLAIHYH